MHIGHGRPKSVCFLSFWKTPSQSLCTDWSSFHLSARLSARRKHHTLGRGCGAAPSGVPSHSVTSSRCTTSFPPSREHRESWRQAQRREFPAQGIPWADQCGLTENTPAGRFSLLWDVQLWDLHSSCPQIAPGWDLFVRHCQCQLSSNYCPVLSAFILQISSWCFFTQALQLHSSNWHEKHSCLPQHKPSSLFSPKYFPSITNLCKTMLCPM